MAIEIYTSAVEGRRWDCEMMINPGTWGSQPDASMLLVCNKVYSYSFGQ